MLSISCSPTGKCKPGNRQLRAWTPHPLYSLESTSLPLPLVLWGNLPGPEDTSLHYVHLSLSCSFSTSSFLSSIFSSTLSSSAGTRVPAWPRTGWTGLVRLLIKATDAIIEERVAQPGLPQGNQFAMADAQRGKNLHAAQQLLPNKYQGALACYLPHSLFPLPSSFSLWTAVGCSLCFAS